MTALSWGSDCAGCGHARLTHRGPAHDQSCSAVKCALDFDHGWSRRSRCERYIPEESPADTDQPYDRARGEAM